MSNKLIHFTRGTTEDEAFSTLMKIMKEKRLLGGTRFIRGNYSCVCFTEAPLPSFCELFLNEKANVRYSPFGIMFDKSWVYSQGGRPVIYQHESEFNLLDDSIRWRHVRYEPNDTYPIDFSWEREWRIHRDELLFTPADAIIVLPTPKHADYLRELHEEEQRYNFQVYSTILGDDIALQYREEFQWRIVTLV
jgi:hypothetical protein